MSFGLAGATVFEQNRGAPNWATAGRLLVHWRHLNLPMPSICSYGTKQLDSATGTVQLYQVAFLVVSHRFEA